MAASHPKQAGKPSLQDRAAAARAAAARHQAPDRPSDLVCHISELESLSTYVRSWALALQAIGTCPNMLEPDSVLLIGNALRELATGLLVECKQAHDLASVEGEAWG